MQWLVSQFIQLIKPFTVTCVMTWCRECTRDHKIHSNAQASNKHIARIVLVMQLSEFLLTSYLYILNYACAWSWPRLKFLQRAKSLIMMIKYTNPYLVCLLRQKILFWNLSHVLCNDRKKIHRGIIIVNVMGFHYVLY